MSRNQRFARAATSATSNALAGGNTATELTKERNRLAADRTLMAWIRTALSLIGFGFGIGKLFEYLRATGLHEAADPIRSTKIFGGSFMILGILALLAAVIQHARILKRLEHPDFAYDAMRPIAATVAIMLLMIGAFGLVGIFL
jgi:putative membrane protein